MGRVRRSETASPGLRRLRRGRGFGYLDVDGTPLRDPGQLQRIRGLVIPPAWRDVWICPDPNGHIQATGIDGAGRRQYIYHPAWRRRRDRLKYDRALALAQTLPGARRSATRELRREGAGRERVLAGAFRMLDEGVLRVGSEQYAAANGSFGLSTLRGSHATVHDDDRIELRFPAKSGQIWEAEIHDRDLARLLRLVKRRGGRARLLAWRDEQGKWRPLSAAEINEDVRARTGGDYTAKDFRTLHGTVAAARSLALAGPQRTVTAQRRAIAAAMREAAAALGNTPAVARSSYVDPRLVDRYLHGETIPRDRLGSAESELLRLLSD